MQLEATEAFRVWDEASEKYSQNPYFISNNGTLLTLNSSDCLAIVNWKVRIEKCLNRMDKNNVLIYENDRVLDEDKEECLAVLCKGRACVKYRNGFIRYMDNFEFEKIGTIHDKKEKVK